MKKYWLPILVLLSLSFTLTACNQNEVEEESRLSLIKTANPKPVQISTKQKVNIAKKVKRDMMNFDEIFDVAVVQGKKDTLVVYKVKHLQRFRMKQIEKNVTKLLEKKYPDETFTVSSDYKIFMEAIELKERVQDPTYPEKKAEKDLEKIIKLKNEQT
jgi:hypothetical protein